MLFFFLGFGKFFIMVDVTQLQAFRVNTVNLACIISANIFYYSTYFHYYS